MLSSRPPPEITLTPMARVPSLAERWRALELAGDGGFFRSWAWVQCQAAACSDAFVLTVQRDGQDMALALLNRAGGRFYLGESGDRRHDALFIEHNGVLLRRGAESILAEALALLCDSRPVVLSGVDAAHVRAARQAGLVVVAAERFAPHVVLDALQGPFLASISANARAQIGRSMRLYGPELAIARAPGTETALAWFGELVRLHQARWEADGHAGAFGTPAMLRFHEELIRTAHPCGQIDLLRVTAGETDIGYLYNLCQGGHVLAYQSGFAPAANAHLKPGLVSHALAIEHYRAAGAHIYDLLAGAARYKTTLAPHAGTHLYWVTLYSRRSLLGYARLCAGWAKRRLGGAVRNTGLM